MRETIATGRNVEEATENGCQELGLSRDEVSVEILEMPARKLFKTIPAKVRISCVADLEAAEQAARSAPPAPQPTAPKPVEAKAPQPSKVQPRPAAPVSAPKTVLEAEPVQIINLATNAGAARAVAYLKSIFDAMGATDIDITAATQGDATLLRVEGANLSTFIETRGETIQAISYLTDRAVNKGIDKRESEYLRVRLDIAGYRGRREGELIALATRTATDVSATGRSRTLAPMNPYERLIIHTTIGGIDGLVSESVGADSERRVVIKSTAPNATDGEDWRPTGTSSGRGKQGSGNNRGYQSGRRPDNRNSNRGDSRSSYNKPPRPQAARPDSASRPEREPRTNTPEREYADKQRNPDSKPVVPERREAISDGDVPLYGKIEL